MDTKRLTRRRAVLVAALSAAPAAVGQQPAGSDLEKARADASRTREALRKLKVPQLLEPSFVFRP